MRAGGLPRPFRFALALAIAVPGALLFTALGIPLAFMLGPMVFCTLAALAGAPLAGYPGLRPVVLSAIGIAVASGVGPDTPATLLSMAPSLLGLCACTALSAAISIFYCRRVAGFDSRTAILSGMPGGLAEMVAMGERYGADVRRIALFHSGRVLFIVLSLPAIIALGGGLGAGGGLAAQPHVWEMPAPDLAALLAIAGVGAVLGRAVRLPAGHLTGPMLLTAALRISGTADIVLPLEPLIGAQLVLGTVTGASFAGMAARTLMGALALAMGSAALLVAILVAFAVVISSVLGADIRVLVLSYSPGGMSEASILALMLSAEVTVVALHHVARLLMVLFGTALTLRLCRVAPIAPPSAQARKSGG